MQVMYLRAREHAYTRQNRRRCSFVRCSSLVDCVPEIGSRPSYGLMHAQKRSVTDAASLLVVVKEIWTRLSWTSPCMPRFCGFHSVRRFHSRVTNSVSMETVQNVYIA